MISSAIDYFYQKGTSPWICFSRLREECSRRIEEQSARAKIPVAVCVIDIHGNVVLKHRMNGAPTFFSVDLSERKAYTNRRW